MTHASWGPHELEPLSAREKLEIRRDRAAEQRRLARRRVHRKMRGALLAVLALIGAGAFMVSEVLRNRAAPWAIGDAGALAAVDPPPFAAPPPDNPLAETGPSR